MKLILWLLIARATFLTGVATIPCTALAAAPQLGKIKLPPGFQISVFSDKVPDARALAVGSAGTVFVGSRSGKVYALTDKDKNGVADSVHTVAADLNSPNGVAFRDGALYIAEISRVTRVDRIETSLANPPAPVVVNGSFPGDTHHGWKFISFGPDGKLYVPIGAPCNICESDDPRYAGIMRMKADGSELEIFASGVRNTVGFDWHPATQELWFTDNGRDWLGDDSPPDELNRAPKKGMHFGYPYCHGRGISDPEFGKKKKCEETTAAALELGPHVASLGMRFYTGKLFPESYRNQIFIAEHGSWNRKDKIGYRITLAKAARDGTLSYETFAEGWLQAGKAWGRPVDVLVMPDGALLVSDDQAGAVYRIRYQAR